MLLVNFNMFLYKNWTRFHIVIQKDENIPYCMPCSVISGGSRTLPGLFENPKMIIRFEGLEHAHSFVHAPIRYDNDFQFIKGISL